MSEQSHQKTTPWRQPGKFPDQAKRVTPTPPQGRRTFFEANSHTQLFSGKEFSGKSFVLPCGMIESNSVSTHRISQGGKQNQSNHTSATELPHHRKEGGKPKCKSVTP